MDKNPYKIPVITHHGLIVFETSVSSSLSDGDGDGDNGDLSDEQGYHPTILF